MEPLKSIFWIRKLVHWIVEYFYKGTEKERPFLCLGTKNGTRSFFQTWNEEWNAFLFSARNEERNVFLKFEELLKLWFVTNRSHLHDRRSFYLHKLCQFHERLRQQLANQKVKSRSAIAHALLSWSKHGRSQSPLMSLMISITYWLTSKDRPL